MSDTVGCSRLQYCEQKFHSCTNLVNTTDSAVFGEGVSRFRAIYHVKVQFSLLLELVLT